MARESVDFLGLKPGGTYVDCTLGAGGHTEAIKTRCPDCRVIGIDQDYEIIVEARTRLERFQGIEIINDNFKNLKDLIKEPVDGILFDLGVSSWQIDEPGRGFSLQKDGPLDMRMDRSQQMTAEAILKSASEQELGRIFREYGEERFSRRVARAVLRARDKGGIKTTFQLKEIVEKAIPIWKKRESATRIFQALRIAVNQELKNLETALEGSIGLLKPGGRIVVMSYHSLEDRIVKHALRKAKQEGKLEILTKKPLQPTEQEVASNPRAKSAKLRAAQRT